MTPQSLCEDTLDRTSILSVALKRAFDTAETLRTLTASPRAILGGSSSLRKRRIVLHDASRRDHSIVADSEPENAEHAPGEGH